jgi:hypothetical protein
MHMATVICYLVGNVPTLLLQAVEWYCTPEALAAYPTVYQLCGDIVSTCSLHPSYTFLSARSHLNRTVFIAHNTHKRLSHGKL